MESLLNQISKINKTVLFVISVVILSVIGYIDYATGFEISISIFYLIPVVISSWFIDRTSGYSISFLSSIILFLADILLSHTYSQPLVPYWNALVMLGFFLIISFILSELKERIEKENKMALKIQEDLLPKHLPQLNEFDIYAKWIPTSFVSGDHYDIIEFEGNNYGICIADVSGHGVPAALLMSNLQSALRIITNATRSPKKICSQLNQFYVASVEKGKFISFFFGVLNTNDKTFIYSNAGHPPPVIIRKSFDKLYLDGGGLLLGVKENAEYSEKTVNLTVGDKIIFYTDGLVETKNNKGELFGEKKLLESCLNSENLSSKKLIEKVVLDASKFSNNYFDDDVTLLVVSVK
jgi:serine phosphatase RsbU (regulator of sigma subunit)